MKHLIADARLRDEEAWVTCACGVVVEGTDAEHVNEPFQRHRVEQGEGRGETLTKRHTTTRSWRDFKSLEA